MAKLTPAEYREKHAKNLKGAAADMRRGIERVSEAPGAKAAEKADKMLANITEAVTSGKWAERVSAVPLSDWKRAMLEKGVGRVGTGVDQAASKIEDFARQLNDYQDGYLPALHDMSDLTIEDSRSRMNRNFDEMSRFRFRR